MLYIALFLVAAALAGVVAALITAESLWAWISIGLSVLAGIVMLVDWFRRRSRAATAGRDSGTQARGDDESATEIGVESEDGADTEAATDTEAAVEAEAATDTGVSDTSEESDSREDTEDTEATGQPAGDAGEDGASSGSGEQTTRIAAAGLPAEEDTDAADLLIVAELETEILVVDEQPRYHLGECGWLSDYETIPLPVSEARELGFSPCARCGPDATLANRHRSESASRADG